MNELVPDRFVEKILKLLGDSDIQKILILSQGAEITASGIEAELGIHISSVYRKITDLKECGLLITNRFILKEDGKKEGVYMCAFDDIIVKNTVDGIKLEIVPSLASQGRRWFQTFYSKPYIPASDVHGRGKS